MPTLNIRRKRGEKIHVGKDIEIKVLDLFKSFVLIAVKAPMDLLKSEASPNSCSSSSR